MFPLTLCPTVTAAISLDSSSIATTVGISVSATCGICFLIGVLLATIVYYATRSRKQAGSPGVAVYDEVGRNKPVIMELDKNSAYGLQ